MEEKIYGLLGRKLGHSWSAPIHAAMGCTQYRPIELEPEELEGFLAKPNLGGLNVTMPYKRAVMPYCDIIDEAAQTIGCVNTLARRSDGKLYAWNTDAIGFCWMVKRAGISIAGKKVVILGSGGASLTAQAMSKKLGAKEIVVISRSGEQNYQNLSNHVDTEIIINTTPLGMYPNNGATAVDLTCFPVCQGVIDVVYNPRRTALLLQAEELGIPHSDGLPMLVGQATAAEEHFFQMEVPDSENERLLALLRQQVTNLVLIGMPGCGKTTIGTLLAEQTGREAIDIDARIVARIGCSISEFFAREGEAAFRALEREELEEAGKQTGKIILTGGGAVKDVRNYAPLHQNGRIYHLLRDLGALPLEGRPLSQSHALEELWREREPLYARFRDVTVDNNRSPSETAAEIWRDFCAYSGD